MPLCPKCQIYEFKKGDKYCGGCRNKLVTFALWPTHVSIQCPKHTGRSELALFKIAHEYNGSVDKEGTDLQVEISRDPSSFPIDFPIQFSIDEKCISLPHSFDLPPTETKSVIIEIDPDKPIPEDQEDISLRLHCKSNDPDNLNRFVDICIYSKPPIPAFYWEKKFNNLDNPVEKIEFNWPTSSSEKDSKVKEKVIRLYNQGGGRLSLRECPKKPDWVQIVDYPHGAILKGSFGHIKLMVDLGKLKSDLLKLSEDPANLNKGIEIQKYRQGSISFLFNEPVEGKTIAVSMLLPPIAELKIRGYNSNQVISERILPCKKGRKLSYGLRINSLGNEDIKVKSWKLAVPVPWARFYGFSLDPCGTEFRANEHDSGYQITLVVDTARFQPGCSYPLEILVYTNAVNSPVSLSLEFRCEKEKELDPADNYIGIDFGTTNTCGAYSHLLDSKGDHLKLVDFLSHSPDQDKYTIPSQILFRDVDDPIMGWRIKEEDSRVNDSKRIISNLKRLMGSKVKRVILGKEYHPEEIAEFIFQWVIDRITDIRRDCIPTKIVATCPAGFYHYQRASILRSCRRALFRRLLIGHGREIIKKINEAFNREDISLKSQTAVTELLQFPAMSIDEEKYEYEESGGIGSVLVKAMIFALEYKYPILSQVEKGASDTSFMKAIHRLTEFLLDYFKDCFTKDEISKDLPLDWEQIINKLESLSGLVLTYRGIIDIKIIDEPTAAAYAYMYLLNNENPSQLEEFRKKKNQNILIIDYGGGTTDISLVQVKMNEGGSSAIAATGEADTLEEGTCRKAPYELEVIATGGADIGGEDIDRIIIERCLQRFEEENKGKNNEVNTEYTKYLMMNILELDEFIKRNTSVRASDKVALLQHIKGSKRNLKITAEQRHKIPLSSHPRGPVGVNYSITLMNGAPLSFTWNLNMSDFNNMIQPEMEKMIKLVQRVIKDATMTMGNTSFKPDRVLLVGKSSNIPNVKKALLDTFNWTENLFDSILGRYHKSCVALGAAYYGFNYASNEMKKKGISGLHTVFHNWGYIRPGRDEFVILDGLSKGKRITGQLSATAEFEFDPYQTEVILIAQSENGGTRVFNNPSLRIIGKYEFTVKERTDGPRKVLLKFLLKESGLLEVEGKYKNNSKFLGYYYQFETGYDQGLPYIFI